MVSRRSSPWPNYKVNTIFLFVTPCILESQSIPWRIIANFNLSVAVPCQICYPLFCSHKQTWFTLVCRSGGLLPGNWQALSCYVNVFHQGPVIDMQPCTHKIMLLHYTRTAGPCSTVNSFPKLFYTDTRITNRSIHSINKNGKCLSYIYIYIYIYIYTVQTN